MEVANTLDARVDPLTVATTITLGVLGVDLRDSVKGLVDVANVVDDETEGKRALVILISEGVLDLRHVGAVGRNVFALEEGGQVGKGIEHIDIAHFEVGVVRDITTVSQVWLVDEMPVALPFVALTLDVVSEGGAFSEGVLILVTCEAGLRFLKVGEIVHGSLERGRAVEESLSLAGNYFNINFRLG